MISIYKTSRTDDTPSGKVIQSELRGLSTDTKPTTLNNAIIGNGSMFVEMDTGKVYMYDSINSIWDEISSSGGGGGGSSLDWTKIGYLEQPEVIESDYDYSKDIYDNWTSATSYSSKFNNNKNLVYMPLVDTSTATDMSYMFNGCANLKTIPLLDTSSATNISDIFYDCKALKDVAQLDLSSAVNMENAFYNCELLETLPLLDFSSVKNVKNMFYGCTNLKNVAGFKDLGENYLTTASQGSASYTLNLSSCNNLTHDSLVNIINNLYDIATKGCAIQNLNLGSTNKAKLSAEEMAVATTKGWNIP